MYNLAYIRFVIDWDGFSAHVKDFLSYRLLYIVIVSWDGDVYHGIVGPVSGPSIHETADVSVDGVDVTSASVDVVDETRYRLTVRCPPVNTCYLSRVPQLTAVGVVTGQVHQEVGAVPFLQFTNDPVIAKSTVCIGHSYPSIFHAKRDRRNW